MLKKGFIKKAEYLNLNLILLIIHFSIYGLHSETMVRATKEDGKSPRHPSIEFCPFSTPLGVKRESVT